MTLGVVYCAVSKSFPGRSKIGKTFRHPDKRIAELQKHYGCAHPFIRHDRLLVDHYSRVEWLAHQRLAHCREPATEMFRCAPEEAMAVIRWAAEEALRNPPQYQTRFQPRPQRAQKRWRRARLVLAPELALAGTLALAAIGLNSWQPDIPDWLPLPVQHTLDRIEHWP